MQMHMRKLLIVATLLLTHFVVATPALAASVSVRGKAESLNTTNSYIDFTNYNSNVTINDATGVFSGYAFSEDLGWFAFGTTDNADGPVSANLQSGAISGKATSLRTGALLDFTNYNSNVSVNISTGVFSGMVFSEDLGWFDFTDAGVHTNSTTLDSVAPSGFALLNPNDKAYTNNERPSFRWRGTSDTIGSIEKYRLSIDNGEDENIILDNIPSEGTSDHETATYRVQYEGFSDSDPNNNYIIVHTKSSDSWDDSANDGKLKAGERSWTVQAHDSNGNITSSSFTLFADFSGPATQISSINTFEFSGQDLKTQDTTPQFIGRVTDRLTGEDADKDVASGPKSLEIKLEKKNGYGLYDLHSTVALNFSELNWETDGTKIADNTLQLSNKYALFTFTPEVLEYGEYRVILASKDIAGNTGAETTLLITISRPGITHPFFAREEPSTELETVTPLPSPQAEAEVEVIKNEEATGEAQLNLPQGPDLTWLRNIWLSLSRAVGTGRYQLQILAQNIFGQTVYTVSVIDEKGKLVKKYTVSVFGSGQQEARKVIARQKELASAVGHWWQYSTTAFTEIVLNKEPTRITNVKIAEIGVDYAIVTWHTNHYTTNNKLNFGETTSYGNHIFAPDYQKEHTVKLEGLKSGTPYVFEVMSQNKNYVYDAHYEFITKSE
jgi:hypothetical protein